MFGLHHISLLLAVSLSIVRATNVEDDWLLSLLKRQEPGTPAFACHSSCGSSVTLSKGPDPCSDNEFLTSYAACLACAGPDDINIWRYYGATLTVAGTKCGLSTTPGIPSIATSSVAPEPATTSSLVQGTSTSTDINIITQSTSVTEASVSTAASAFATSSPITLAETTTKSETTASPETTRIVGPSGVPSLPPKNGSATTTSIEFTGAGNSKNIIGLSAVAAAIFALVA